MQTGREAVAPTSGLHESEPETVQQVVNLILTCHNAGFRGVNLRAVQQTFVLTFWTGALLRDVLQQHH
ncbi:hypothetical protein D3C81_2106160 [compost metagenome]